MKKLITKKDFILVLIVLVVGFASLILINSTDKGKIATIKVDGKVIETLSLDENTSAEFNGVAVVVKDGEIYVTESTCTDKVCVRSGKVSKSGEGIICAPNRVSIEIDGKSDLPDAMTG